jgi:hypothetical protein
MAPIAYQFAIGQHVWLIKKIAYPHKPKPIPAGTEGVILGRLVQENKLTYKVKFIGFGHLVLVIEKKLQDRRESL